MSVLLLGIDPGFAKVGWAIAELTPEGIRPVDMGLIVTKKSDKKLRVLASDDNVRRGREIVESLDRVLAKYDVIALCAEAKSFPRNASAAAKVAICWGILIKIAVALGIPLIQARPQEIKQKLCGKKNVSKKDIQDAVDLLFGVDLIHSLVEGIARSNLEHPYDGLATVVACSDSEVLRLARRMVVG